MERTGRDDRIHRIHGEGQEELGCATTSPEFRGYGAETLVLGDDAGVSVATQEPVIPVACLGRRSHAAQANISGPDIMRQATEEAVWGIASSIDIYDCDPERIRSAEFIRQFVVDLCDLIEMKRFGETQVVHFGEDEKVAGFSMVQLIETSLISAHFANLTNATYLDVFSCKPYDPQVVQDFAERSFLGSSSILHVSLRR